jgi:bacteriocin biosynthesis cyclodehydratase domain-containing protein
MEREDRDLQFTLLPFQILVTDERIILRRGTVSIEVQGSDVREAIEFIVEYARGKTIKLDELISSSPIRLIEQVNVLCELLLKKRLLVSVSSWKAVDEQIDSSFDRFLWELKISPRSWLEQAKAWRLHVVGLNFVSLRLSAIVNAAAFQNVCFVNYPYLNNEQAVEKFASLDAQDIVPLDFEKWSREEFGEQDIVLCTADFPARAIFQEWNIFCQLHDMIFFPVMLENLVGFIGPIVIPHETPCYECLVRRENDYTLSIGDQNYRVELEYSSQFYHGFHPSLCSILADMAYFELFKFLAPNVSYRPAQLIDINLFIPKIRCRNILYLPNCPVCSDIQTRSKATVVFS